MTASAAGSRSHTLHSPALRRAAELVLGMAAIFAVMATLGWMVTGRPAHVWPLSAEDGLDRFLAQHRSRTLNLVSGFFSTLGNTQSAIALSAVAFFAVRILTHRWVEAWFVATALLTEVSVFLLTTVVIERSRPAVRHLDHAPPTSSFPSGHTAAAVALYAAVALVLRRHGAAWPAWLLLAVPCAVGCSRLYRGMHHPSDVAAGALLGALCLLLARRAVLSSPKWATSRPAVVMPSRS